LIARRNVVPLLRATAWGVVATAVLNLTLISMVGLIGAAIATLVTEPLVGALMFVYAGRNGLPFPSLRRFWPPILASALMATTLATLGDAQLFVQVGVGTLVYFAGLFLMGFRPKGTSLPRL